MGGILFLTGFSVIYLQIALVRLLSAVYYGTVTYFIISLALTGFGAGGTFLAFRYSRYARRFSRFLLVLCLAFAFSIPLSLFTAFALPLNLQFLLYSIPQVLILLLFSLILFIPFFFGGTIIGAILIRQKENRGLFYGINLTGSGAGGLAALGVMYLVPPSGMPLLTLIPAAGPLIILFFEIRRPARFLLLITAAGLITAALAVEPRFPADQYKDIAHFRRLEQQGDAVFTAERNSPYGQMTACDAPSVHMTLFAGLENRVPPPPQIALFNDGSLTGALFRIRRSGEAAILRETAQSLPYRLSDAPRVLIAGDSGLTGAWLALGYGAEEITLILPGRPAYRFLTEDLAEWTGPLLKYPEVHLITGDWRRFLLNHPETYDIIHLAGAETISAYTAGLYSFQEDYLLTVESFRAALDALAPEGLLSVTRGIQLPPRDNLKLLLTAWEALEQQGTAEPENHLLMGRNYLAAVTVVSRSPLDSVRVDRFLRAAGDLAMDAEYYPGMDDREETEQINRIPGPEESGESWFRGAARRVVSGEEKQLVTDWIFDLRPGTDNRPFFSSFFRGRTLGDFRNLYGRYWFRRSDLGYLILLITFVLVLLMAFVLILLPHLTGRVRLGSAFFLYFPAAGLAFMFLELVMIQKFALFLGHSSFSVALVLTVILVCSGLGSMAQERLRSPLFRKTAAALLFMTASLTLLLVFSNPILRLSSSLSGLPTAVQMALVLIPAGIPAFFMGWFFAPALTLLEAIQPDGLPAAWALNGFASVAASPLAVLLSISFGFRLTGAAALLLYLFCVLLAWIHHRKVDCL